MTTFLGLATELARDVGASPSLRELVETVEQKRRHPEGPLFERAEVRSFVTWLEQLGERVEVETMLRLTSSLPPSLVSAETVGRELVQVLYDPALTGEMRAMLYAAVRVAGRSAVLYHARGGDLDDGLVAHLFATQHEDALHVERLFDVLLMGADRSGVHGEATSTELDEMQRQIDWNRSVLDAWMAGIRAAQG